MSDESNKETEFTSSAPFEKYDSIVNELKLLPYESLDCACSICQVVRSNPTGKNGFCKVPPTNTLDPNLSADPSEQNDSIPTDDLLSEPSPGPSKVNSKNDFVVPMCVKCWTVVGKGIAHPCTESSRQKNLREKLSLPTRQKLAAYTIHETANTSREKNIEIKTGGRPLFVCREAIQEVRVGHDFFFNIQADNPSISNDKLINIGARYRKYHGGNSVEPHFVSALNASGDACKKYFNLEHCYFEQNVTGLNVEVSKPLVFCNNVRQFINFVKEMRDIRADEDYVAKFGLDGGGGSIKVTMSLIKRPENDPEPPKKKAKSSNVTTPVNDIPPSPVSDNDDLNADPDFPAPRVNKSSAKAPESPTPSTSKSTTYKIREPIGSKRPMPRYLESGVKQMFIIASAPGVKETYENVKQILDVLKVFDIASDGIDFLNLGDDDSLHTDLKEWNNLFGIMSHSSHNPCTWCESKSGEWVKNAPRRTLGRIRMLAQQYQDDMKAYERAKEKGDKNIKKPDTKDYFSCVRMPLIGGNDNRSIYDVCPLPELHILTGVLNHIFVKLNDAWGGNKAFKWAEKHYIASDAHHGLGFKGPNSRRVLHKAKDLAEDRELPRELGIFADALVKFDKVVAGSFGMVQSKTIQADIRAFEIAFMKLGISVTPKVHAVIEHLPEFLALGYGPLGPYSEQTTEAAHYDFAKIWAHYPSNSLKPDQVAEQHYRAILKYTWLHLKRIY